QTVERVSDNTAIRLEAGSALSAAEAIGTVTLDGGLHQFAGTIQMPALVRSSRATLRLVGTGPTMTTTIPPTTGGGAFHTPSASILPFAYQWLSGSTTETIGAVTIE